MSLLHIHEPPNRLQAIPGHCGLWKPPGRLSGLPTVGCPGLPAMILIEFKGVLASRMPRLAVLLISLYRQGYYAFLGDNMPTRHDFECLIEWCDKTESFDWLKAVAGVALAVHPVLPIGSTSSPRALALLTGNIALREAPGISELPEEPVRFDGTLVGLRNPGLQAQLTIRADGDRIVSTLSGLGIPSTWSSGFDIEHVQDESGLIHADWTFSDDAPGAVPPANTPSSLLSFEMLLWPALRTNVDLGPP